MTTTPEPEAFEIRALASGTLVEVAPDGRAELLRCSWLLRVPSGHPEPDSEADCWTEIECAATYRWIEGGERMECEHGHRFGWTPRAAEEEFAREDAERRAWQRGEVYA
jgi:hypothetical protein